MIKISRYGLGQRVHDADRAVLMIRYFSVPLPRVSKRELARMGLHPMSRYSNLKTSLDLSSAQVINTLQIGALIS